MMPEPGRSPRWLSSQPSRARAVGQPQHAEAQRGAGERSPDGQDVLAAAGAELVGHVGDHTAVRRGRRRQHRHPRGHLGDEVAQAPVVGAEVVPPVADAVRLVDHQHAEALHEGGQLVLPERGLFSRSGETSSTSTSSAASRCSSSSHSCALVELIATARTPARSAAATWSRIRASSGETSTVGPAPRCAQEHRRDEVDRRLAPPGALHDEGAAVVVDERLDGLELAVVELGGRVADEAAQDGKG